MRILSNILEGETVRINNVDCRDGLMRRAMELGFHAGETIEVIRMAFYGTILKIKGTIYGVGREATDRIAVD